MADVYNFNIKDLSGFTQMYNQVKNNKFLRDTLIKGFPKLWEQFKDQQKALNILYQKNIAPSIEETTKAISTSKPTSGLSKALNIGGKIAKGAGVIGSLVTEGPKVLNPKNSLLNRVITAGGIGLTAINPVAGLAALGLAENQRRVEQANRNQTTRYDKAYEQWVKDYGTINPRKLDPSLKPLGNGELALYDAKKANEKYDKIRTQSEEITPVDQGVYEILNLNTNIPSNSNSGYSMAPQQGLSFEPLPSVENDNQQGLMGNTASSLVTPSLIRGANEVNMDKLNTMVNEAKDNNVTNNQPVSMDGLNMYAKLLGEQRAQEDLQAQAQQQVIQEQYANLINQYKQALQADTRQNNINTALNALGSMVPQSKPPVYLIGAKGDLQKIEVQQPNKVMKELPTNVSANVDAFKNMLALNKAQQQAVAGVKPTGNQLADMKELMTAQALANHYKVDPVAFLNPELAKTLMTGQNTIQNTNQQYQNELTKIPVEVQAKITEEQNKHANAIELININNQNERELVDLNQEYQNQRTILEANQAMERLKAQGAISYKQAMDLERLRQQDPNGYIKTVASLVGSMSGFVNPNEGQMTFQNTIEYLPAQYRQMFNYTPTTGQPAVQDGQLTPAAYQIIMNNRGR